jgi:hypothetical protein
MPTNPLMMTEEDEAFDPALVYLKNAYSSFATNSGTGGNFTVTGTLTDAGSAPST